MLERLKEREDGPFVVRLLREPGNREVHYAHLFGEKVPTTESTHTTESTIVAAETDLQRLDRLKREVSELHQDD